MEIAATLGTVKSLLDIVDKIQQWAREAVKPGITKEKETFVQILENAAKLVAALRTLDNVFKRIVGQLTLFHSGWSNERREMVLSELNDFARQEHILPIIRQSLNTLRGLKNYGIAPHIFDTIEKLISHADKVYQSIEGKSAIKGGPDYKLTPGPASAHIAWLLANVYAAKEPDEANIRYTAEAAINVIDRKSLMGADQEFGKLKGYILAQYPDIPDPGWAVVLS